MRNAARSARSPRCRRQSRAAPLATSIRLSKPKPTSATLPARNPASKATRASRLFHAMVKYSRRWARATARAWVVTGRARGNGIIPGGGGQAANGLHREPEGRKIAAHGAQPWAAGGRRYQPRNGAKEWVATSVLQIGRAHV